MNNVKRIHLPKSCYGSQIIEPEGIALHGISARYTSDDPYDIRAILKILKDYGFSYHEIIRRHGSTIETAPTNPPVRAWHAGVSQWKGRHDCNSWMIGLALEGMDGEDYTDAQYDEIAYRIGAHVQRFPKIPIDNVVGHCHIAPDRKTDPWNFDWDRLYQSIRGFWP